MSLHLFVTLSSQYKFRCHCGHFRLSFNHQGAKKNKADRKSQAHAGAGAAEAEREDFGRSARDVWITVKYIFTNPVWIFLTVAGTIESGAITGFAAFLPKVVHVVGGGETLCKKSHDVEKAFQLGQFSSCSFSSKG